MTTTAYDCLVRAGGDDLVRFADACLEILDGEMGDALTGVYIVGSVAAGAAVPDVSDLDVLVVVDDEVQANWTLLGERLADFAQHHCPLRGIEAVVYRAATLLVPAHPLPYVLNVNAGRRMARRVTTSGDPAFWFLLDVAAARSCAVPLSGPAVHTLVGQVPRRDICRAVLESLAWHREHDEAGASAVLNACRSWHWLDTGEWAAKTAAGAWALTCGAPPIVGEALRVRRGEAGDGLSSAAVDEFLTMVEQRAARACEGPAEA